MMSMKVFFLIFALAALASSFPPNARRGKGHGRGRGRGHRGPKYCEKEFSNGTTIDLKAQCFKAGGLIDCQEVNMNDLPERVKNSPRMVDVVRLTLCKPITCKANSTCSDIDPRSFCTSECARPNKTAIHDLKSSCSIGKQGRPWRPKGPKGPRRPQRPDDNDDDDDNDSENNKQSRCSIPPEVAVAKKACKITMGTTTFTRPCRQKRGQEVACKSEPSCTFTIAKQSASLSFCDRPQGNRGGKGGRGRRPPPVPAPVI